MSSDSETSPAAIVTSGFAFDSLESVRKKLLDLTGRNALLNYKHPKASCIRLIDELPDQLVEELQSGNALTFIPVPEPTEKELIKVGYIQLDTETKEIVVNGHPTAEQWAKYIGFETKYDLPEKSVAAQGLDYHQDNDMQTLMYAPELEARLRNLRSKAETAIEEGGANILYLGIGFLEWIENPVSEIKRLSPLFTVPVKLDRASHAGQDGAYRYSIKMKDDGLITNITLREKLANDFGLVLPPIEDTTTPEGYFKTIEETILRIQPKWRIRRQASLVLLNFTKQAMYQDLDPNNWPEGASIEDHPLIQKFFSSASDGGSGGSASYEDEHPIDHVKDIHDDFPIVFDADSSQHSALIDAANGENLVIEGPPGSGKSQTIANLIAACIGSGKSVLFVAEKMAALNVVKDRLDKAGLGDFCLELHSHKTNKQKILGDLDTRLHKQSQYREPDSIKADIARFEDLKIKLSEYVVLINSEWENTGLTLHDIFNKATRYREQLAIDPETLKIEGIDGSNLTLVRRKELFDQADMLAHIYELVSGQAPDANIANHYWYGVNNTELMGYQSDKLSEVLSVWTAHLQQLSDHWSTLNLSLEMGLSPDSQLSTIENIAASIEQLPELIGGELFEHFVYLIDQIEEFEQWLQDYEDIHQCHDKLTPNVTPSVIGDMDVLVKMNKALSIFQKLGLAQNSTLEEISGLYTAIQSTIEQVAEIDQQFAHIKPNLPPVVGGLFVCSRQGLQEVNSLISLITALPQDLWRYRDDIYDNPDLDPLLEVMTEKLRDLTPLHQALHEQFSLHRLPDSETLKQHQLTIESGGFFKWLSSDWRQSRKAIIALAAVAKPKAANLLSSLPDLVRYTSGVEAMDRLNSEDEALHDLYKGVDTPMERAIALRQWYKAVRAEYGLGFGDRVALGDALLSLDRTLAMGIKDYANQDMGSQIKAVLSASSSICKAVHAYPPLADVNAVLEPPLAKVGDAIKTHLTVLQSAVISSALQIGDLGDVCALIEQQHRRVNAWRRNALAGEVLEHGLPLSFKANEFSPQHLASGRNSIEILKVLAASPGLLNSLLAKPEAERYRLIRSSLGALQQHLSLCSSDAQQFTELGKVNMGDWMESSSGVVNKLISRNKIALENPNWLNTWLDYIRLRLKLSAQGLNKIIAELERSQIGAADLNAIVQLVINHQLAVEILARHTELALFSGMEQMANRKKFQEYDRKIMY